MKAIRLTVGRQDAKLLIPGPLIHFPRKPSEVVETDIQAV
jgi:hypothetical protein